MRSCRALVRALSPLVALLVVLPAQAQTLADQLKDQCVVVLSQSRNPPLAPKVDATRDKLTELLLNGFAQGLQQAGVTVLARFYPTSADDLASVKANELGSFMKTRDCKWLAQLATFVSPDQKMNVAVSLSPLTLSGAQKDTVRIGDPHYAQSWNYVLNQKFMTEFKPQAVAEGYARSLLGSPSKP